MTYFHIADHARSLHLVVSAWEGSSGSVICTTTDFCNAQEITKLLNQQQAAVTARCEAEATSARPVCPPNTVIRSGVIPPPPPPPAPENEDPEASPYRSNRGVW